MQNILFLVHIQEEFRRFFPDPLYPLRVRRSAMAKKYTQVISLVADIDTLDAIPELETVPFVKKWYWSWGYEKDMFCYANCQEECHEEDCEGKYVIESYGHEYTYIPPQLRAMLPELRQARIFIGGGYASECLEDWRAVLMACDLEFTEIRGLIY